VLNGKESRKYAVTQGVLFAGDAAKALYAAARASAKETAAAVAASGRAAAEGVKRRAHRAETALREAGQDLARAPAVRTEP
jgi:hypothetical protein